MPNYSVLKYDKVELVEPDILKVSNQGQAKYHTINKEVQSVLYNNLLKLSRSSIKTIHKILPDKFQEILHTVNPKYNEILNEMYYIELSKSFFDTSKIVSISNNVDIINNLGDFLNFIYENDYRIYTYKIPGKDIFQIDLNLGYNKFESNFSNYEDLLSIILDFEKSKYYVYNGIDIRYYDSNIRLVESKPLIETDSFDKFLYNNLETEILMIHMTDVNKELSDIDLEELKKIKVSLHELLEILSKLKVKFTFDKEGYVESLIGFKQSNSNRISEYIKELSSGMTYKTLLNESVISLSLRYSKFNLLDLLEIITDEIGNDNLIDDRIVSYISQMRFNADSYIVDTFLEEVTSDTK